MSRRVYEIDVEPLAHDLPRTMRLARGLEFMERSLGMRCLRAGRCSHARSEHRIRVEVLEHELHPDIRLKRATRYLSRVCRMRCLRVEEVPDGA